LFPPSLDDCVAADNPVRAIDAHVDSLDLEAIGFRYAGIHGSRRLEAATRCTVEVMWLCQNARPGCKTIADFRKGSLKAGLERSFACLDKLIESHCRAMDEADAPDSADERIWEHLTVRMKPKREEKPDDQPKGEWEKAISLEPRPPWGQGYSSTGNRY